MIKYTNEAARKVTMDTVSKDLIAPALKLLKGAQNVLKNDKTYQKEVQAIQRFLDDIDKHDLFL